MGSGGKLANYWSGGKLAKYFTLQEFCKFLHEMLGSAKFD
jgi:hypothetical protein